MKHWTLLRIRPYRKSRNALYKYTLYKNTLCKNKLHTNTLYKIRPYKVKLYKNTLYKIRPYNRIEAIKQTTFFVVTQSFTLSSDLQTTKSSTQFLRIYTYLNMVS